MSDDESEEEEAPAVELGEGPDVEGAPLARVSARLTWGIEHSTIVEREGETTIRTPDGPGNWPTSSRTSTSRTSRTATSSRTQFGTSSAPGRSRPSETVPWGGPLRRRT